jgi:hypothetical protein
MQDVPTDMKKRMPSSRVLEEVIHQAPAESVKAEGTQHAFNSICAPT